MSDRDRFESKVDRSGDCHLWGAALDGRGYGQFKMGGKSIKAHRAAFFFEHGRMPSLVRHSCDNRACVNPRHLLEGSYSDNLDDMYQRERNSGLNKSQVEEIRARPMTNTIIREVARDYDISEHTARAVLNGSIFSRFPGAREIVRQKSRGKLSVEDIKEIKRALKTPYWGQVNELAARYGVTHSQISNIKSGLIHGEVSIDD